MLAIWILKWEILDSYFSTENGIWTEPGTWNSYHEDRKGVLELIKSCELAPSQLLGPFAETSLLRFPRLS